MINILKIIIQILYYIFFTLALLFLSPLIIIILLMTGLIKLFEWAFNLNKEEIKWKKEQNLLFELDYYSKKYKKTPTKDLLEQLKKTQEELLKLENENN